MQQSFWAQLWRGITLHLVFRERIEHGIELYRQGTVRNLLFTGGSGDDGEHTEAEVGQKYAIAHGVDPADIRIETKSRITEENLVNSIPDW